MPYFICPFSLVQEEEHRRLVEEKEAEVMRLAEEEAKARAHAEMLSMEQTEDAFTVISDLDNALKAFQGALGLSDVSTIIELVLKLCNILKMCGHKITYILAECLSFA